MHAVESSIPERPGQRNTRAAQQKAEHAVFERRRARPSHQPIFSSSFLLFGMEEKMLLLPRWERGICVPPHA